jgi:EAL domain-containing protein (putative c-di-GMP-specific phosphodiesterase class I)
LVADRMLSCLDAPVPVGEGGIVVRASAGVALGTYPQAAGDLLRQADTAMYLAKSQGKSRTQVFQAAEHRNSLLRLQRVAEMERGLERNEFVVHYQPVVDLEAGTVKGFEALVRWQHPERGLLPPAEFIALAEESGFIVALGDWVLRESCRQLSDWRSRFDVNGLGLSVNLSMEQVRRTELEVQVRGALDDNGLDAGRLTLEITESVLLDDHSQVNGRLGALKDLGVNLALDDFGTGYSSLAYLQQFPIDTLKIDRAFVAGIEDGHESTALVSAIMNLGRSLSLQTVAEGIERPGQLSALQRLECTVGQGFYFARPMAPADVDQLLADGGRLTPA